MFIFARARNVIWKASCIYLDGVGGASGTRGILIKMGAIFAGRIVMMELDQLCIYLDDSSNDSRLYESGKQIEPYTRCRLILIICYYVELTFPYPISSPIIPARHGLCCCRMHHQIHDTWCTKSGNLIPGTRTRTFGVVLAGL